MKTNCVLIDGDYLAYKAAAGKDEQPLDEVLAYLDDEMHFILSNCKEAFDGQELEYVSFFSGRRNDRKVKYPDYKSNRKGEKPALLSACRLHMQAFWNGITVEGIEADDAIGVCAHYLPTEDTIIATADKDFAQMKDIWVYDLYPRRAEVARKDVYIDKELTEDGVWYRTSDESALKQLTYQLIYGDAGDGVKGIPSFDGKKRGHKKAALAAAFKDIGHQWEFGRVNEVVAEIYESQFGFEEGSAMFDKVYHLVYIQEFYCNEFKEIPKMKKYEVR